VPWLQRYWKIPSNKQVLEVHLRRRAFVHPFSHDDSALWKALFSQRFPPESRVQGLSWKRSYILQDELSRLEMDPSEYHPLRTSLSERVIQNVFNTPHLLRNITFGSQYVPTHFGSPLSALLVRMFVPICLCHMDCRGVCPRM
jgi:hypothetical protein